MLHPHSLEGEEKELTSLFKHTTLIFLFNLNSAKNLNSFKHSHTTWNFKSQMKEGEFIASGAVTSHSLANKIHLHLRGLLSKTSPDWCLWFTNILTLSLPHPWVFQRQIGKWTHRTLGADHQAYWLEHHMSCNGTTCRGLGNGWQRAASSSGRLVTDSRPHSTTASDGPPHSKMGPHLPAIKK